MSSPGPLGWYCFSVVTSVHYLIAIHPSSLLDQLLSWPDLADFILVLEYTNKNRDCSSIEHIYDYTDKHKVEIYLLITLGNRTEKKICCPGYFTWFLSIRGHRYLNEKPFCTIRFSFPAMFGFWGDFLGSWTKFLDFSYSICTFQYTQNDRLNLTLSMQ